MLIRLGTLMLVCAACRAQNEEGAEVCGACGGSLAAGVTLLGKRRGELRSEPETALPESGSRSQPKRKGERMTGGRMVTLRIDLNRLKDNRISTSRTFVEGSGVIPVLHRGDVIQVVEEEGDYYLATVRNVHNDRVDLTMDLDSLMPAIPTETAVQDGADAVGSAVVSGVLSSPEGDTVVHLGVVVRGMVLPWTPPTQPLSHHEAMT